MRVDKWLWAARFFKTRALATDAVLGGHVQVNGVRVKPAKDVRVGDALQIRIGTLEWTVDVRGLADRRGPATVARTLYEETAGLEGGARAAGARSAGSRSRSAPTSAPGRRSRTAAGSTRYGARSGERAEHREMRAREPPPTEAGRGCAGAARFAYRATRYVVVPVIDGQHLAATCQVEPERPDHFRRKPSMSTQRAVERHRVERVHERMSAAVVERVGEAAVGAHDTAERVAAHLLGRIAWIDDRLRDQCLRLTSYARTS